MAAGDEWGQMVILHFSVAGTGAYTVRTITVTSTSSISSTTLTFSSCSTLINVNGTEYCALDVSSDILLGNPGYSYFMTADAIVFNGVTFRTICPSGYEGCPNAVQNSTVTIVGIGAISLGLTFQDKANETLGSVLGDFSGNLTILSNHRNPRAGFSVEYVQPTGTNKGPLFRTFLLVQAESQQITTSTSTVNGDCTHTMTFDGRETCSAPMDYSTLNELVHDPNNSFTNYGNGTIILYVGHNACTIWFYYLPNETSVIEYLGVTGSETCGVPPNTLPLDTTFTQTTDNTTTTIVENLGGASAMRFELQEFSLCASNCAYPSPFMSGMILFISNSTTAVSPESLQYFVNGTGSSVQTLTRPSDVPNGQNWAYVWKSGANGVSVISGKAFLITFVITYADGITQSASIVLIAD